MPDINGPVIEWHPAPSPLEGAMNFTNAVALMRTLKPEARLAVMDQFCKHCGSNDPRCQCWNDE